MGRLKIVKCVVAAMLMTGALYGQNAGSLIKQNAISCDGFSIPNAPLYDYLKNYKCISIGEMHGTQEPAALLVYLTRLFANEHRHVVIGLEAGKAAMAPFVENPDSASLAGCEFFSGTSNDGRASEAWFSAIAACSRQDVSFCFFDAYTDSAMCQQLLEHYRLDISAVILTLGGNVHTKFTPYQNESTMGCYLKAFFGQGYYSINHIYSGGTMYNHGSEGLVMYELPPVNAIYAHATDYHSYLLPNASNVANGYSGYFYTEKVSASPPYQKTFDVTFKTP